MLWRSLSAKSGINVVNLVDAALNYQTADRFEDRNKIMTYLTRSIDQYVYMRKRKPKRFDFIRRFLAFILCVPGRRMGSYLLILFFVTKLLFIVNSVGQLFLLNVFLGHNFASYGVDLIRKILNGEELAESMYFPRVTMCEFAVRNIQNVHVHTVQVNKSYTVMFNVWSWSIDVHEFLVCTTDQFIQWESFLIHLVLARFPNCMQYIRSTCLVCSFVRPCTIFVH
jgi:innexin